MKPEAAASTSFFNQEPVRRNGSSEGLTKLVSESTALTVVSFTELDLSTGTVRLGQAQYSFTLTMRRKQSS